jgi:hypothetical protein
MSGLTFTRAAVVDGQGGIRGEVREYGRIANTATALDRLRRKLGDGGVRLRFCHEAGSCGYGIQRHLARHGHECVVVAPSLIPKRADDRIKTDRRDAASLARLHRAGERTAVWVPDPGHEAMRGLGARPSRRGARVALGAPATGFLLVMRRLLELETREPAAIQLGQAAGPDVGSCGGSAANHAQHGARQCGDVDRRVGRPLALRQSAPADGLSRIS